MRGGIVVFASLKRDLSSIALGWLLVLAGLVGDRPPILALRGPAIERLGPNSQALGYYEALIHDPRPLAGGPDWQPPPGWQAFGAEEAGIVQELPSYLRWNMKPKLRIRWNGTEFRTNRLGFRGPEIEWEKPAGTYRILVFGSSNTMGYGVNNEEMYTCHMERWLNEWVGPAYRVEVVNLAVSGDSPSRRLYRLQQEARRFAPDWLLCDVSPFDAWLEDRQIHSALQRNLPIPFSFVRAAIHRAGVGPEDTLNTFRVKFQGESERMFDAVYAGWGAEARRLGVPLTIVILPRADSTAKSPRLVRSIRALADRHGLDHLDLSEAFDSLELDEFRIGAWNKHPSARGHLAIFEAIRDALKARGCLPGFPPPARDPEAPAVTTTTRAEPGPDTESAAAT